MTGMDRAHIHNHHESKASSDKIPPFLTSSIFIYIVMVLSSILQGIVEETRAVLPNILNKLQQLLNCSISCSCN
jgi:hypothetical protein